MNQQKPQRLFLPRRLKHTGRIAAFFSFLFLNSGVNARLVAPIHICRYPERDLFLICVFPTSDVLSSSRRPSSLMNFFCSFSRPVERFSLNKNRTLGRMLLKNISGRLCYDDSSQFNTRVPFLEKKKKSCRPFLSV